MLKICFLLRTMIFTLLTSLCYKVLFKAKYFHCYRQRLTMAIFKGKRSKTVNIFSEKYSIILLNPSRCLLCCQLRFQCHYAELKANDAEVCFISMCMTGGFVVWKKISLNLARSLRCVLVCRSLTWIPRRKPCCMKKNCVTQAFIQWWKIHLDRKREIIPSPWDFWDSRSSYRSLTFLSTWIPMVAFLLPPPTGPVMSHHPDLYTTPAFFSETVWSSI